MASTEKPNLQAFVLFPIDHWDEMMEIVAKKFGKSSIDEVSAKPEPELFPLFAAAEGETEPTHRMCAFPTTIPVIKHYKRDLPSWITIEFNPIEYCVSPREFLSTQGMTLLADLTLQGLNFERKKPTAAAKRK